MCTSFIQLMAMQIELERGVGRNESSYVIFPVTVHMRGEFTQALTRYRYICRIFYFFFQFFFRAVFFFSSFHEQKKKLYAKDYKMISRQQSIRKENTICLFFSFLFLFYLKYIIKNIISLFLCKLEDFQRTSEHTGKKQGHTMS